MRAALRASRPDLPGDVVDRTIAEYVTGSRWSTDAVFTDFFRLLFRAEDRAAFARSGSEVGRFIRAAYASPAFAAMRHHTQGDPAMSALGAILLMQADGAGGGPDMASACGREAAESYARGEAPESVGGDQGEGDEQGEGEDQQCGSGQSPSPGGVTEAADRAASRASQRMADEADRREDPAAYQHLAGRGYAEPKTSLTHLGFMERVAEEALEPASRAYMSVSRLMRLFGRMEESVLEAMREARLGDGEVVDVARGPFIDRMAASEWTYLADTSPEVSMLFDARLVEGDLAVVTREGLEDAGGGPLLLFVDCSGSMEQAAATPFGGMAGGSEVMFALAGALSLCFIRHAAVQRRRVLVVPFNDGAVAGHVADFDFKSAAYWLDEVRERVVRALCLEPRGGTNFTRSLADAAAILRADPDVVRRYERADVVFVSDGLDGRHDVEAAREAIPPGGRLFGFFVCHGGWDPEQVRAQNDPLFDYCHAVPSGQVVEGMARFYAEVLRRTTYARSSGRG